MKFNEIFVASTSKCNGKCFACSRQSVKHLKEFKDLDTSIIKKIIKYSDNYILFGNLGDFIYNDNALDILTMFKIIKPNGNIFFTTNAGKEDDYFWKQLARIMNKPNRFVEFDVDDIDSKIELYRGISTELVYHNIEIFVKNGGYAKSKTLIFKGNENKIDKIRQKLKNIGVKQSYFICSRDYLDNDIKYSKPLKYDCETHKKIRINEYLKNRKVYCELEYKPYLLINELGEVLNCCGQNMITMEYHLKGILNAMQKNMPNEIYNENVINELLYLYEKNKDKINLWNKDVTIESAYNNEYNIMYRKFKNENPICRYFCSLNPQLKREKVFNS